MPRITAPSTTSDSDSTGVINADIRTTVPTASIDNGPYAGHSVTVPGTPKYQHTPAKVYGKDLTGDGGGRGLISHNITPALADHRYAPDVRPVVMPQTVALDAGGSIKVIPVGETLTQVATGLIDMVNTAQATRDAYAANGHLDFARLTGPGDSTPTEPFYRTEVPVPDRLLDVNALLSDDFTDGDVTGQGYRIFADISPQTLLLRKSETLSQATGNIETSSSLNVYWKVTLFVTDPADLTVATHAGSATDAARFTRIENACRAAATTDGVTDDQLAAGLMHAVFNASLNKTVDASHKALFKSKIDRENVWIAGTEFLTGTDGEPVLYPSGTMATTLKPTGDRLLDHDGVSSFAYVDFTYDVLDTLKSMIVDIQGYTDPNGTQQTTFSKFSETAVDRFADWSTTSYDIYDRLCDAADLISSDRVIGVIGKIIDEVFASNVTNGKIPPRYIDPEAHINAHTGETTVGHQRFDLTEFTPLARQLRYLEKFPVDLDIYTDIFDRIDAYGLQPVTANLVKQNMQLDMNLRLRNMADIADQLPVLDLSKVPALDGQYSEEQRRAILAPEPLILDIAGAGCGKSTTLVARIGALLCAGVMPEKIMALSFTHAAADNLTERLGNNRIPSMTIAAMIHSIYTYNFPTHQQSNIETMINTIRIRYGKKLATDKFLIQFVYRLEKLAESEDNAMMTAMAAFVENNEEKVLGVINDIKQSDLSMEIIIASVLMDKLSVPFMIPEHIIIDEVQDNSTYEFLYMLRFAYKHKCALYLVGDPSQTLYEFRSADPRALNALENSGVFAIYTLTTNYRSNEEVLLFANKHLAEIEANQYANIQLRANSFDPVTPDTFRQKVQLVNQKVNKVAEFKDPENIKELLMTQAYDFIRDNIARGEETCILSYNRANIKKAAIPALNEMFPDMPVANLTSDRSFNTTTFSKYIEKYWDEVVEAATFSPVSAPTTFIQMVKQHLMDIEQPKEQFRDMIERKTDDNLKKWWMDNTNDITGWQAAVANGNLTVEKYLDYLRDCIIDHEMRQNAIVARLTSEANDKRRAEEAASGTLLKVSTIHGVKGLEFDNVILIRPPESDGGETKEEAKRIYYVALTRPKKQIMVLTGSKSEHDYPRIVSDWDAVVSELTMIQESNRIASERAGEDESGTDITVNDTDIEAALDQFSGPLPTTHSTTPGSGDDTMSDTTPDAE